MSMGKWFPQNRGHWLHQGDVMGHIEGTVELRRNGQRKVIAACLLLSLKGHFSRHHFASLSSIF